MSLPAFLFFSDLSLDQIERFPRGDQNKQTNGNSFNSTESTQYNMRENHTSHRPDPQSPHGGVSKLDFLFSVFVIIFSLLAAWLAVLRFSTISISSLTLIEVSVAVLTAVLITSITYMFYNYIRINNKSNVR